MGNSICNETSNECVVGKDIFVKMGRVVEDSEGVIDEGALGVHVDEACDGEWGSKESVFEQVGVEFLALGEVCIVGTRLEGGNACLHVVGR